MIVQLFNHYEKVLRRMDMPRNEFTCDCAIIHEDVVRRVIDTMPENTLFEDISTFFKVMGDHTRIRIIWVLYQEDELCVCDLANALSMTKSAISHQLGTLRRARLVKCRRVGKTAYYSIADDHVKLMFESAKEHVLE